MRSEADQVDDSTLMQSMSGNFMVNETRKGFVAPQKYGVTSVLFDAEKGWCGRNDTGLRRDLHRLSWAPTASLPVTGKIYDQAGIGLHMLDKGDTAIFAAAATSSNST